MISFVMESSLDWFDWFDRLDWFSDASNEMSAST
jgi:hypothetical protein